MAKRKLFKINEALEMANILEDPKHLKGNWENHFGNDKPLILELGCGKGHYTLGMGEKFDDKNFIGIDIKGPRLWKGGKDATELNLQNVQFARLDINQIDHYFEANEVSEIWITFPDPQAKKERRRLTHPSFLKKYGRILKPEGIIHLKTDNSPFFEFTLGILCAYELRPQLITRHLYHADIYNQNEVLRIKTHYEALFSAQGATIKYCAFKLPPTFYEL